ncbi:MAG: pyruvate, water dikinase regulatory protein [Bacteroidales bacterium]|nr:pyruvate, water dikinase regulatory protein [Bacteroidales bacterium]
MNKIYAVSDGTGRTAAQALQAVLTQFKTHEVEIILKAEVRTEQQIEEIVAEVSKQNGFIIHTLVSEMLRESIQRICRIHNVEAIDLIGPLILRLTHFLNESPQEEPGLFFTLNKEYFKRIDSMQFAFNHDDGLRSDEYDKAEIILVGVSRTFKTPLSIFLAYKGWFVANYPVVIDAELPESLAKIPYGTVFGLSTEPHDLSQLRIARQEYLGGATEDYASVDFVRKELNYAQRIFNKFEWPVIQVTNKPIEEIASEILAFKRRIDRE